MKLKFFHTFWISYWNLKEFKSICILCIVMDLKYFPIENRLTCAKIDLNKIKVNIKPMLWSCRLTLELELCLKFNSCILQWISNPFGLSWQLVHIIVVPLPLALCYFYLNWYTNSFICIILTFFYHLENIRFVEIILFYKFVDCPPLSCLYFVSLFRGVDFKMWMLIIIFMLLSYVLFEYQFPSRF